MTAQETAPLNQYVEPVAAHKKLIAVVALVAIGLGVGAGVAAPTTYSSTTSILVYPVATDPTSILGSDDKKIDMPTEIRIAASQAVAASAAEQLAARSINLSTETLIAGVTASSPKESSILDISFVAPSAARAQAGANAIAEAYLQFRTELADNSKLAAETAINERINLLNQQLNVADPVESLAIEAKLAAQQSALADVSTLTVDATTVIDHAALPESPEGLGLIQLLVGAVAGGLALGVLAAYAAAAIRPTAPTRDRANSDRRPTVEPSDVEAITTPVTPNLATETAAGAGEPAAATATAPIADPAVGVNPFSWPVDQPGAEPSDGAFGPTIETPPGDAGVATEPAAPMIDAATDPTTDPVYPATEPVSAAAQAIADYERSTSDGSSPSDEVTVALPEAPAPTSDDIWATWSSTAMTPAVETNSVAADTTESTPATEPTGEQAPTEPVAPAEQVQTQATVEETTVEETTVEASPAAEEPTTVEPAVVEPTTAEVCEAVQVAFETALANGPVAEPAPTEHGSADETPNQFPLPEQASFEVPEAEAPAPEPLTAAVEGPETDAPAPPPAADEAPAADLLPALTASPDIEGLIEILQDMGRHGPIVGLTLGEEGVGTSIAVAFGLADALQALGANVLMIDAALEDPLLAPLLSIDPSPGLAEVLTGSTTLKQAVRPIGGLKGLDALAIGQVTDSTIQDITGPSFERLIAEARVDYHTILVIAGTPTDRITVPALAALADGLIVGTTQEPGTLARADLCRELVALPAPVLDFLSQALVVEREEDAVVADSPSM